MAETLGSLCDKLTIIKLKQWHSQACSDKIESLLKQEKQIISEINNYLQDAVLGNIKLENLSFAANKVYDEKKNQTQIFSGSMGQMMSKLSEVNCELWHTQEKIYDFSSVPADQKDLVIQKLAILNLDRNQCIDQINTIFQTEIAKISK